MEVPSPHPSQMFAWDAVRVLVPFSKYWWDFKPWKSSYVFISSLWVSKFNMVWFHFMNATLNLCRFVPILSYFLAIKSLLIFHWQVKVSAIFSRGSRQSPSPSLNCALLAWVVAKRQLSTGTPCLIALAIRTLSSSNSNNRLFLLF